MGHYKKGILGHFRGKVGTVVGAVMNGIYYMKSLPDFGDDHPTEAQLNPRSKVTLVGSWLKKLKLQIRVGFQLFNKGLRLMLRLWVIISKMRLLVWLPIIPLIMRRY